MIEYIPYPCHELKLLVVLSPAEVISLFQSTPNLKHRTILMTIYAAGLRVSELMNLRVSGAGASDVGLAEHFGYNPFRYQS